MLNIGTDVSFLVIRCRSKMAYNDCIYASLQIKVKESPRVFNRGMNLVNNFAKIFGSLK